MREVRHLPPWMLQRVGASHVNSDNVGEKHCCAKDRVLVQVPELKANTGNALKKKTRADHKGETSRRKLRSQVNCEVKRRRVLTKKDGKDVKIIQKGNKRDGSSGDRAQNSSIKERQSIEHHSCSCDKYPAQSSRDEEIELTVTDLMAIAEEYVSNYKQQQEGPDRRCSSQKHNPKASESGSSFDSLCKNNRSSAPAKEALYNSTPTTTNDVIYTTTCHTRDPAQDMLDLLLGPLLKKPLEEKKNESVPEDLTFNYEVGGQIEGRVEEEMVPLEKKKCSLRHKVAMFLN